MKTLYFTATGNSLYVARCIGGELLSIPQLIKEGNFDIEDDAVGIVCPAYFGRAPKIVKRFLERANIKTDYLFYIATYGMSAGYAPTAFTELLAPRRLKLNYAAIIKMVDNSLPTFDMDKQKASAYKKDIDGQIARAKAVIKARKNEVHKASFVDKLGIKLNDALAPKQMVDTIAQQIFKVTDACVLCGTCVKVCPMGNVTIAEKVTFGSRCERCYACIQNCPRKALHLKKEANPNARFRNEHVSLADIIQSNNQVG